jgi:PhnB protein
MADVKPVPEGYPSVSPYLVVDGAAAAIDFYADVFGARERMRMGGAPGDPADKVGHAELELGDGLVMLADEFPDVGALGPKTVGGTPVSISVYVEDVDDVWAKAMAGGAKALRELRNEFYGDRVGDFEDPWGHRWHVATHVEDVSPDEMAKRAEEAGSPG